MILTHIPEARPYALAILAVFGLSAFSVAGQLRGRWLAATSITFPATYCGVLVLIAGWGYVTLASGSLTFGRSSPMGWIVMTGAGLGGGWLTVRCDRLILRRWTQATRASRGRRRQAAARQPVGRPAPVQPILLNSAAPRRSIGVWRLQKRDRPLLDNRQWSYPSSVAVAVLEEVVYRGVLLQAAQLLPGTVPVVIALGSLVVFFGLSHIWFGWVHVLAKLPLGLGTTLLALGSTGIWAAIVAHVLFNLVAVRDRKGIELPDGSREARHPSAAIPVGIPTRRR